MGESATTIALVRDLMFVSKITATAAAAGTTVRIVRAPAKLEVAAGQLLLVDLNLSGAIPAAVNWRAATGGRTIGFVSHVDAATAAEAKSAGIDHVVARSRFVDLLPGLLAGDGIP